MREGESSVLKIARIDVRHVLLWGRALTPPALGVERPVHEDLSVSLGYYEGLADAACESCFFCTKQYTASCIEIRLIHICT